ncbi:MAG: polyprenyl synthetase family protein [Chloroflexi bacterium]|nr:polyprenyl synthetase family protein [Chloroflexota bacterium]MCI0580342.1 polyprenyl synthetase family protein [Chloroflexota bacterium]MCI0648511.1 polyprenyl synthetase family protein [Chloroflexota bacterium]MCI0728509.1 polyprenyl synthetase family protein [Chloroflexota bacterium]
MSDALKTVAEEMLPAAEQELRAALNANQEPPDPFHSMLHYQMGWVDEQLNPAAHSGKGVRPLLCLLACQAAGGNWSQALPAAAAVELIHNFTLIHDDIQDASPTRRGRPTVWRIWGEAQAINAGDAMFAFAHLAINRLAERGVPAPLVVQATRRLDEACIHLTLGQHHDMRFEQRHDVTVAEYLAMIGGKTAALLSLSAELGALVAGRDPATVEHYAVFGRDLGLAFQMRDDILGIWGDESLIGKSAATDIATRKKSLPVLHGLAQSQELRRLYIQSDNGPGFVERVANLLDDIGAREFAEAQENAYSQSALHHLAAAAPQEPAATALHQLTARLLNRQS